MRIGIAGPMTLRLLDYNFESAGEIPVGYDFPMLSMLVNELLRQGHRVVAYTTSTGIREPLVYKGENLTICIARRRTRHAARDLFKIERGELSQLMLGHPVDVINAQWSYEFAWSAIESGTPTLVTLQDHALRILRYQIDPYRLMRLIMNQIVLNRAKHISTNSQYLFSLLSERNKRKARVIPNFYARELEEDFSTLKEKNSYIVSVSNGFGARKNISTALKAFEMLRKDEPHLEYHLVGDGMETGGPAHEYALKNGLTRAVRFIGRLPYGEALREVKRASVFLHPSREESFGMSVLEAMVLGTPVVGGSHSGNVPFLLNLGRAGLLCDVDSPEDIAGAIRRIFSNPELSQSISLNAIEFARTKFREDVVVKQYLQYYGEILDRS
jgi:glycosyltransferase involved in cell wall biosynthesis